jgi:hypothetical protein
LVRSIIDDAGFVVSSVWPSALTLLSSHVDRESGITPDVVLFLTEAQERMATPPARAVELTVAKNRHGDTGKVGLIFRPDLGTLREEAKP